MVTKSLKSISFRNYDTIPDKFKIFSNVEYVKIYDSKNIKGLECFPKIKSIYFLGSTFNLKNQKWTEKLVNFRAEKSNFKGLTSFKQFKNAQHIYMAYSGFELFPDDFHEMKCLREIVLVAYMPSSKRIDLSKIDLSKNNCIKKVRFHDW